MILLAIEDLKDGPRATKSHEILILIGRIRRRQDCEIWIKHQFLDGCAHADLFVRRYCRSQKENVWV